MKFRENKRPKKPFTATITLSCNGFVVMSAAMLGESVAQAALAPTFVVSSTKIAMMLAAFTGVGASFVRSKLRPASA